MHAVLQEYVIDVSDLWRKKIRKTIYQFFFCHSTENIETIASLQIQIVPFQRLIAIDFLLCNVIPMGRRCYST